MSEKLPSPTPKLMAEIDGPVGLLTINNPNQHNAVSYAMWQAVAGLIKALDAREQLRVIVITGAGNKAFVSGADISEFKKTRNDADAARDYERAAGNAFDAIARTSRPVIAKIRGFCLGGGLGLAAACDLRLAAEDATFAIPAARLGLAYGHNGLKKLIGLIGPARTKELIFTAQRICAAEAKEMGLVNRVFPSGELDGEVEKLCTQISANAPLTIAAAKSAIAALLQAPENYDAAALEKLADKCFASDDYTEGCAAFMEKRPAQFKGS